MISVAVVPELAGVRDPDRRILKVIVFMVGTGCGPGETYAVRVEDFNPSTNEVLVRAVEPGAGKTPARGRWVHLPPKAVALLGELPTGGRAFLKPDGQPFTLREFSGGQLSKQFRKLCEAASLGPDVVQYTLRHTWATWFSAQVGDHDLLLDRGGWAKSDTARKYRKKAPADLADRLYDHGWDFRARSGQ
mgnify:CR=1 FL=1